MNILFNSNKPLLYQFTENITIKFQKKSPQVTLVFFQNSDNEKIKIPNQIEIYDMVHNVSINPDENNDYYVLFWGISYSINFGNQKTILFNSKNK